MLQFSYHEQWTAVAPKTRESHPQYASATPICKAETRDSSPQPTIDATCMWQPFPPVRPSDKRLHSTLFGPMVLAAFRRVTSCRAGVVTSMMDPDAGSGPFGLAYIKTLAGGVGLKVRAPYGRERAASSCVRLASPRSREALAHAGRGCVLVRPIHPVYIAWF